MAAPLVDINKYAAAFHLPALLAERDHYANGKRFEFKPGFNAAMVEMLDQQIALARRILEAP